jgi:hypothetical protein
MEWHFWLVPLIAVAVWILGSLLRSGAEERQRMLQRQNPGGGPDGGRQPQRPNTDLDRFLQEVHRRRQASERRDVQEEPPPVPERADSRPKPRPVPPPVRQPPPPPRRPAVRPASPPPAVRRPQTRTVEDPTPVVQVVVPASPTPVDQLPAVVPVLSEVGIAPGRQARKARTATYRDPVGPPPSLAALLSSPEGLRNAFILREILDAPLCKRRSGNT